MKRFAAAVFCIAALAPGEGLADSSWRREFVDVTKFELLRSVGKWHTISLSQGGELYAVFDNNAIRLFETGEGREIRLLNGHSGRLHDSGWSRDGRRLATTAYDGTVRVWEVATGRTLHKFAPHEDYACSVAFSDDGRWLATGGSKDGQVRLTETGGWQEVRTIRLPDVAAYIVGFTPDSRHVVVIHSVTAKCDTNLRVYRTADGSEVKTAASGMAGAFAFSPDGRRLAYTRSGNGGIAILETSRWTELGRLAGNQTATWSLDFHPSGRYLASSGRDGLVRIWDVAQHQQVHALSLPDENPGRLRFSEDGTQMVVATGLPLVRVYGRRPSLIPAPPPAAALPAPPPGR